MKTICRFKIVFGQFLFGRLVLFVGAATLLSTLPALAIPSHEIVLTENSSTSLTATYDASASGISVIYISTDHWGVTFGPTVSLSTNAEWIEPDDSSAGNAVTTSGNNQIIVNSDFFLIYPSVADGTTVNNVGIDTGDGLPISMTFHDNGDVALAVPEAGSSLALLAASLTALLVTGRFIQGATDRYTPA